MEKEQKHTPDHKMCDWCGNQYGEKYSWLRLVVAILIGLFIFSAGYHLGELKTLVKIQYGYGNQMMMHDNWRDTRGGVMMNDMSDQRGTTTDILLPAAEPATVTPTATVTAPRP